MTTGARRLLVPLWLTSRIDEFAEAAGQDPADVQELALAAALPTLGDTAAETEAEASAALLRSLEHGPTTPLPTIRKSLTGLSVAILRMGPPRVAITLASSFTGNEEDYNLAHPPLENFTDGYPRHRVGMKLTDTPEDLWAASRGYWRMREVDYLAPTRFGSVGAVYKVTDWRSHGSKLWAGQGSLIDRPTRELIPILPDPEHRGRYLRGDPAPATDADLRIVDVLQHAPLRMGKRATNPVIPL